MRSSKITRRGVDRRPIIRARTRERVRRPNVQDIFVGAPDDGGGEEGVEAFMIAGGSEFGATADPYLYYPGDDTYEASGASLPAAMANNLEEYGNLYSMRTSGADSFVYDHSVPEFASATLPPGSGTVQLIFPGGMLRGGTLWTHDPAADSWTSVGAVSLFTSGNYYKATATGGFMYASVRDTSLPSGSDRRWKKVDLASGAVTDVTPAAANQKAECMVAAGGKVYASVEFGAQWWSYDPAAGTWATGLTALGTRDFYNAHPNADETRIYQWGGYDRPGYAAWQQAGAYYSIADDTWTEVAAPPAVLAAEHISLISA